MTSGSMAQFFNVLFPFARLAAIKIFCVAPTLIFGNLWSIEFKLFFFLSAIT